MPSHIDTGISEITPFARRLKTLDVGLFSAIQSQSCDDDKRSWLALQNTTRDLLGEYSYLEIGSYLGGRIQPYLLDPKCRNIYSIDARKSAPDVRSVSVSYFGNSEEEMVKSLCSLDSVQIAKLTCIKSDARCVDPGTIKNKPALCFIDGEHTRDAVISDFQFCRKVAAVDSVIYFHDDIVLYEALGEIVHRLKTQGIPFRALKLGGVTFALTFGNFVRAFSRVKPITRDGKRFLKQLLLRQYVRESLPKGVRSLIGGALRRMEASRRR